MTKLIELDNLTKEYNGQVVLKGIHLDINEKEFVTLLGPSGCGKTTTLRIMGGFEEANGGRVLFDGQDISSLPPYKRELNTVFQKYALFPHMNVFDNIAFGLKIKKMDKDTIKHKVERMLKLVGLEGFGPRNINQLSGGQQQRVAIARALVNEPKVLLLDEPLGALDLKLRKAMQIELKNIQQEVGITFVYVTHDQEEALTMSDTIVVMNEGQIQQIGSPTDIYNEPENRFVAQFIGDSNIIEGTFVKDYLVSFDNQEFECVDKGFDEGQEVDIVLRPEDLDIVDVGKGKIEGVVRSIVFKGVHYEIIVETKDRNYMVHTTDISEVGKKVNLDFWPEDIHVMEKMGTY
ncbi:MULTISPECIES: spermidine/putrescine ABC transporter ATP-binding protein [unclassified Thomasclavelia]|uniref:spermidine/putrescine ABC transporter ATP-binding protein n=1 Tax=unclassified Thomasclavelia TaxID=3025756 RepID=UPI000B36C4AC|nr:MULTISPECIES: spermidine/putrescine ABC transporter ATP-binding protein [unclassified Thomasclavelia]OUP78234.1 spermidine/putrescine ABC transporter ATP-binding protein [Erysipelatoclostridium sp. An173]OUQ08067.1 spermidine/putrescine ABC transporter ATP-binding protein [Erysipelatoclostridium sp. An15]